MPNAQIRRAANARKLRKSVTRSARPPVVAMKAVLTRTAIPIALPVAAKSVAKVATGSASRPATKSVLKPAAKSARKAVRKVSAGSPTAGNASAADDHAKLGVPQVVPIRSVPDVVKTPRPAKLNVARMPTAKRRLRNVLKKAVQIRSAASVFLDASHAARRGAGAAVRRLKDAVTLTAIPAVVWERGRERDWSEPKTAAEPVAI